MDQKELARRGEAAARAYLARAGMRVMETNWSCAAGEADIIAIDGDVVVVVEVKTRRSVSAGTAEEALSATKRARLVRIATHYLAYTGLTEHNVRFDVVAVYPTGDARAILRHYRDAFTS